MVKHFCDWLSGTGLSVAFQSWEWFVPLVQTVHILGIAVVLIAVYTLSFRLVGLSRSSQPLAALLRTSLPWTWRALGVLLLTGILLTITEPERELLNNVFRAKMLLVLILAAVLWLVQKRVKNQPGYWSESPGRRSAARALGLFFFLIGAGIVTAGRWIAYV
jgi:hypothetical protein